MLNVIWCINTKGLTTTDAVTLVELLRYNMNEKTMYKTKSVGDIDVDIYKKNEVQS